MHLGIKMLENGRIKVLRGQQAPNKVPLFILDIKMLEESFDRRFYKL